MSGGPVRMRVLVVEDNPDEARAMSTLLQQCGYEAPIALDGPDAQRQAADAPPDVVLLNIDLPGMAGWEVARCLRQLNPARELFIIAVTTYGAEVDHHRSADEGIHFHLVKPVTEEVLMLVLEGLSPPTG